MQHIEPYFNWRDEYIAAEDEWSPFYGRDYSEFEYSNTVYNYYIHPQWDEIGSPTLYLKILFADYDQQFAIIELMGEWNDCIENDVMTLKRNVVDKLLRRGITKFIFIGENMYNFHADDDSYYEEWYEEACESSGWIAFVNLRDHVSQEMREGNLQLYLHFGDHLNELCWRTLKPLHFFLTIEDRMGRAGYYICA